MICATKVKVNLTPSTPGWCNGRKCTPLLVLNICTGWSLTPLSPYLWGTSKGTHWIGGRVGPQSLSGRFGDEKGVFLLPGFESRYSGSRYPRIQTQMRRAQLKCDGTRWRTGGEVKGKQANGVGSQYSCILPRNMVCPSLLTTIKTYDKPPSSMVSCELSSNIRQFQHHCFCITLTLLLTQWFQLFPVLRYDIDIFVNCNWVDTRWQ